jgi:hypothetical protein
VNHKSISTLLAELDRLHKRDAALTSDVLQVLAPLAEESADA